MNFIKKIGIAAALFGAVTVANAQVTAAGTPPVTATGDLPIKVTVESSGKIVVTKGTAVSITKASGETNKAFTTTGIPAATDVIVLGKAEVEVKGWPYWDVWVEVKNGLTLKTSPGGATLLCDDGLQAGTITNKAEVVLQACYYNKAITTTNCTATPTIPATDISTAFKGGTTVEKSLAPLIHTPNTAPFSSTELTSNKGTFVFVAGVACPWNSLLSTEGAGATFNETINVTLTGSW